MESFSNNELLSEQIWDADDIPEKELFFGQHSGSAMPLTWAIHTKDAGIDIFYSDIDVTNTGHKKIEFTFLWTKENNWENKNFSVERKIS